MSEGLNLVLEKAFTELQLHRIECAVQPNNEASIRFLRKNCFNFDGYAPFYLHLDGEWREHLKFSLTREQWCDKSSTTGKVEISKYQAHWPLQFNTIRETLFQHIGPFVLEHIGSTAVPGLPAKPIIDIQLGVQNFADVNGMIVPLKKIGLEFVSQFQRDHVPFKDHEYCEDGWEKRFFRGEIDQTRVNLHIRLLNSANWRFALLFRDYLRSHDSPRIAYGQFKQRLAETPIPVSLYSYAKDPVCDLIFVQAEKWAAATKEYDTGYLTVPTQMKGLQDTMGLNACIGH